MKRLFILLALNLLILNTSQAQYRRVQVEAGPVIVGGIAGGAFILMGSLQQPDEKWIQDPKGPFYNMGQKGYWRNETFWEDRNRIAAVATGLFIFGASITIKF